MTMLGSSDHNQNISKNSSAVVSSPPCFAYPVRWFCFEFLKYLLRLSLCSTHCAREGSGDKISMKQLLPCARVNRHGNPQVKVLEQSGGQGVRLARYNLHATLSRTTLAAFGQ